MEKSNFAREVPPGSDYQQFSGKVVIESVAHSQGNNAVLIDIGLEGITATPEGFGTALGMTARQFMENIPPEHHAAATLQMFMAIQSAFMKRTLLETSEVPS